MNAVDISNAAEPRFGGKACLAGRYSVSPRTIQNWMQAGLLVYFKVKRVVRFDIRACDESLRQYGFLQ